jgi:hypothetical protein
MHLFLAMKFFKRDIYLTVDYRKVIEKLKMRIDDRQFFKGYFDNAKSVVYYCSNSLPNPLNVTYFPLIEIEFEDLQGKETGLRIGFKVISLYMIAIGLIIVFSWIGFIFMMSQYGLRSSPGIILPLVASICFPLLLKHSFDRELFYFRDVLREIENEISE